MISGLQELVRLRHDGNGDIPIEFVGFDSELDAVPSPKSYPLWEPAALADILKRTEPYMQEIQRSCAELLGDLWRRYPDDL